MKHKTHKIVSINILYFLIIISCYFHRFYNINAENFIYYLVPTTFLTLYFSTLPDFIEGHGWKNHRTWAHSLYILTLIILILFILKYAIISNFYQKDLILYVKLSYTILLTSILIGWGSHLLLDFFTDNGIPLLYPLFKERMQIYKFSTYTNDSNEQCLYSTLNFIFLFQIIILIFIINKYFNILSI
jgi:membrane-bound metal-dependent hydrolase YbcI (DUF457 family)